MGDPVSRGFFGPAWNSGVRPQQPEPFPLRTKRRNRAGEPARREHLQQEPDLVAAMDAKGAFEPPHSRPT